MKSYCIYTLFVLFRPFGRVPLSLLGAYEPKWRERFFLKEKYLNWLSEAEEVIKNNSEFTLEIRFTIFLAGAYTGFWSGEAIISRLARKKNVPPLEFFRPNH